MYTINKFSVATLVLILFVLGLALWWSGGLVGIMRIGRSQTAAVAAANLSTAADFSVLASLSASSANTTTISGDLGLSPGFTSSRTGSWVVGGNEYFGDSIDPTVAANAQSDAQNAFNDLQGQTSDGVLGAWGGPTSLTPGVYTEASDTTFSGTLTLDGGYDDVWVFQIGNDMTFSGSVILAGNAQACNVFWQVGNDATIAAGSQFVGTLIASNNVTLVSGADVNGRIVSLHGALTTDSNTITGPTCTTAPAPTTGTLHVIKSVINTNGGTATSSDFTLHVKNSSNNDVDVSGGAGSGLPGVPPLGRVYTLSAGVYTVSEDLPDPSLYTQSFFGADCVGGSVTVVAGEDKVCTIINTDIPPPVPATPEESSGGGSSSRITPLIGILKVPTPLTLPGDSGSVTYNYTVWNAGGKRALTDVTVTDDKCGPVAMLSGDVDNDGHLDVDESWKYSCTMTLSTTTTNTAMATGYGLDSYHDVTVATAIATVVVGTPGLPDTGAVPSLIDIVKVPSRLTPFPFGGGSVTYTYTVTNPGLVPLREVTVTDDKCASVSRMSGDVNSNDLLEPDETWTYTCQTNVRTSTTNVATATGKAHDLIAIDYAFATVLVSAPYLPNTGLAPENFIDKALFGYLPTWSTEFLEYPHKESLRLKIPNINVDTTLETVGTTSDGAVGVPKNPMNAGWFNLSSYPGENGNAVIVGHFGWKEGKPAVFDSLHTLQKGDKLSVEDKNGVTTNFIVREVRTYKEHEDASAVFKSNNKNAHLVLITCGGVWNEIEKSYSERFVVLADKE